MEEQSEIELCRRLMVYIAFSPFTKDMKGKEAREIVGKLFPAATMEAALEFKTHEERYNDATS